MTWYGWGLLVTTLGGWALLVLIAWVLGCFPGCQ